MSFLGEQKEIFMKLCQKYNKFMSGGTDYHANNKPHICLGTGIDNNMNVKYELVKQWVDKIQKI